MAGAARAARTRHGGRSQGSADAAGTTAQLMRARLPPHCSSTAPLIHCAAHPLRRSSTAPQDAPEAAGRPDYAFMAFGAGPRKCIGLKFALHEAAITLARLLQRYSFSPDPVLQEFPPPMRHGVTTGFKEGVWLRVTERPQAIH